MSGYLSPHIHVCMAPMERPSTSRQMIDPEAFGHEQLLRVDHVVVAIVRKFGAQTVARLARAAAPDRIRYDQIIFLAVERLPACEELTEIVKNGFAAAVSAMQKQHGVDDMTSRIAPGRTECHIVDAQFRQGLAVLKMEVARNEIVLSSARILRIAGAAEPTDRRKPYQHKEERPLHAECHGILLMQSAWKLESAEAKRIDGDQMVSSPYATLSRGRLKTANGGKVPLERDDFSSNRHPGLTCSWSMIFSENRCPLFGIML